MIGSDDNTGRDIMRLTDEWRVGTGRRVVRLRAPRPPSFCASRLSIENHDLVGDS